MLLIVSNQIGRVNGPELLKETAPVGSAGHLKGESILVLWYAFLSSIHLWISLSHDLGMMVLGDQAERYIYHIPEAS